MGINGSPSMSQVAAEFGGSAPHALSEYRGVSFSDGSYAPVQVLYLLIILGISLNMLLQENRLVVSRRRRVRTSRTWSVTVVMMIID